MPEWSGRGLQNLAQEFDSPSDLQGIIGRVAELVDAADLKFAVPHRT